MNASPAPRTPSGLAVTVAVLMVLSSLGLVAALALPTLAAGGTAAPVDQASSRGGPLPAAASQALGADGACAGGSSAATAAISSAASHYVTPAGVHSPPLFNSQVEPYAVLTGPYAYVAGGAALRDLGYGYINLSWPGGSTSNLVAAYMVWSIMDDSVPSANATLNGVNLTGTWTAYATPSPCWAPTYIYSFVADVTGIILNGNNTLTNFPSGITNGGNPWAESQVDPMDEGATLVAVYVNESLAIHEVTVYTGALTTEGGSLSAYLNYTTTDSSTAETTYMVADGQLPDNEAVWAGSVIDPNAFPGSAPKDTAAAWSYGNLYDTKTYGVSVIDGSDSTSAAVVTDGDDCVTWIGQVVDVQVAPAPPPYAVVFQEQGLLDGTTWSVTTNGETSSGIVADGTSSISFEVTNGSYSFVVGSEPGYETPSHTGSYTIDGGGAYIRVLFHPVLYAITFQESGSPVSEYWSVELNNTSQGLNDLQSTEAPATIVFDEPNGTYNFTAATYANLYSVVPASGVVVVSGSAAAVTIDIVPPELFNVTFLEVGLPAGTAWGANTYTNWGDFSNATTDPSFSLQLPNTTAGEDEVVPYGVHGYYTPSYEVFTVVAAPETVEINYSAVYPVYLNETGLPSGTYFYASLSSTSLSYYGSSDNGSIWFFVPNGTYAFTVEPIWGYQATPSSGTVTVLGGPARQPIVFSPEAKYDLTFDETGLPSGTSWSVELYLPNGSAVTEDSTTASITFQEPNGSFEFVVGSVHGFQASPYYGYPEISGSNTVVAIGFEKLFSVTFDEVGLDLGGYTYWYVYLGDLYNYSYGPSINFTAPNGTYDFEAVAPYWDHTPDYIDGTVTVADANVTQTVPFGVPQNFTVTFTETGLPPGTTWFVNVTGGASYSSSTDEVLADLPNGSYAYTVGSMDKTFAAAGGSFTVSGAPVPVAVTFSVVVFTVTFKETGVPAGATWYLNLSNGRSLSTSASSLTFSEPNGSYPYAFGGTEHAGVYYTAAPGTFLVHGSSVTVSATFTEARQVLLTEKNLPKLMEWWANVTGGTSFHTVGSTIEFYLPVGTWTFTVQALNHDYAAPGHTVVVTTPVKSPKVAYTEKFKLVTFKVMVTESGLPKGSNWCIVIDGGKPVCSKTTSLSVMEPNGTYTYTLTTTKAGFSAPGGTFVVSGKPRTVLVTFKP